ncbi:MAG TPA: hypothetical protein VF725_09530 [Ktedonobacterales bacterium]
MQRSQIRSPQTALQHLRRALSRAVLDIVMYGLIGVFVGIAATEGIGWLLTGSVPSTPTHVAAAVVAALLAYAIVVTVVLRTVLAGLVQSAEWVVGEVERFAGGVVHEAESVLHIPEDTTHTSPAGVGAHAGDNSMPTQRRMIGGIQAEP